MFSTRLNLHIHQFAMWAAYLSAIAFPVLMVVLAVCARGPVYTGLIWAAEGISGVYLSLWLAERMGQHVQWYRTLLSIPIVPRRAVVAVILASGARVRIGEPDSFEMNGHQ